MKQVIILIFAVLTLTASGQAIKDKTINNIKTEKHVNIPGTRLYIVPPSNFKIASNFVGLLKDGSGIIHVYDTLIDNYSNYTTFSLEIEEFKNKGAKVFDFKELTINGFPAKYLYFQGDSSYKGYILDFGDSTFSTMILAAFPTNDDETGKQIYDAIMSFTYDKDLKIDPFESASFKLDDKVSKFKFHKTAANLLIYSIGGVEDKSNKNAPNVIVNTIPFYVTMTPELISEMSIAYLEKYGLSEKKIKNKSTSKINGDRSYETEIYCKISGQKSLIYQLVVINGDLALVIQGIAKSDFENNLIEFKKLSHTVRFKK